MATIREMSAGGNPTEVRTITMVTRPAWGIPAAPMLAAVAVILKRREICVSKAQIMIRIKNKTIPLPSMLT